MELVHAVTALGKPTDAVVSMGRPQGLAAVIDELPAGAHGVLRRTSPGKHDRRRDLRCTNLAGKLPITLPRHVGQVPIHHAQKWGSGYRRTEADIHRGYLDMKSTPLFAFGHGLSYTTFEYGPLRLKREQVDVGDEA